MENKKRKMFAAVAVIMLCAVAIVGVGYAYTAQTWNEGNTVTSEYITLSQTGEGAYKFANNITVFYDTVNRKVGDAEPTTTYTLTEDTFYNSPISGATVVHLGKQITVHAVKTNGTHDTISCTFETSGFNYSENWLLYIVINGTDVRTIDGANDAWDTDTFNITYGASSYNDVTFDVYYGYTGNTGVVDSAPASKPLDGATIKFIATQDGNNPGIVLNSYEETLAVSGTFNLTATLKGITTADITYTSSSDSIAEVTSAGVITAKATGDANITASVSSGGVTYTAVCVVHVTSA